ncbi:MAG TPA: cyclic pyranopterin monophosphate synthase MoaC [Thermoplasmataceae archaeon]|nr:cyclic pyranopterin monophosphate synthase MoaC [Thermoplasmatales archaeon AK]HLH85976.1 cyclic pyranopterin monophosphate synthase MoaC [Thermoplasmataceae archaeon]
MIDVSEKPISRRTAIASGKIKLKPETVRAIRENRIKKGDVGEALRIAAIQGVKTAWMRLPFCHQIPIEAVDVTWSINDDVLSVRCEVLANYKTGVEMDALTGVSTALLTVWDMVKYIEKDETGNYPETMIYDIKVEKKVKTVARAPPERSEG